MATIPETLRQIADQLEQGTSGGVTFGDMGYQTGGDVATQATRILWEYAGSNDPVAYSFAKHKFDITLRMGPGKLRTVTPTNQEYPERFAELTDPVATFGVDLPTMKRWLGAILTEGGAPLPDWFKARFPSDHPA